MKYLEDRKDLEIETRLSRLGRAPAEQSGMVNMPVCRGSTIVSDEARKQSDPTGNCGRFGSSLSRARELAVANWRAAIARSCFRRGFLPARICFSAFLSAGDHVLISDGVYTRQDIRGRGTLKPSGHRAILLSNAAFRAFSENHPEYPGHLSGITFVPHVSGGGRVGPNNDDALIAELSKRA